MDYKAKIGEALKNAEKELYKVNNALEELKKIEGNITAVYDSILSIERMTEENPSLNNYSRESIQEKKILSLYKKMDSLLEDTRKMLKGLEEEAVRANLFLESFRTGRNYFFPDFKIAKDFIDAVNPLFSISSFSFKPEFIGMIDLSSLKKDLGLEGDGKQNISVPTEKIKELLEYLERKRALKNSKLENELLKIIFKSEKEVLIEGDNSKIRRLDRLAKEMGASYSGD